MTHVLVTFLGAPDTGRPPSLRKRRGYQQMHYRFPPDGHIRRHRLFPLALLQHLRRGGGGPRELVVFGTRGSVWDELLRYAGGHWSQRELNDLIALALKNQVNQAVLKPYQDPLRDVLGLDSVRLEVLEHLDKEDAGGSRGDEVQKQIEIIERLNKATDKATKITIDVTHGLRYMPLLGSLAAYVVESTRSEVFVKPEMVAKIDGIWYGALDRKKPDDLGQEIAPAINLAGLSRIVDWLAAFKNFEWDGDYWAFADVLKEDDNDENDPGKLLAQAAFFERIGRFREAEVKFKAFDTAVDARVGKESAAHSMINLFKEDLSRRIALSKVSDEQLYEHQCGLAWHHLKHEDVVHAAIWGREAAVTRVTIDRFSQLREPSRLGLDRDYALRSFDVRREANRIYYRESSDTKHDAYKRILGIRNKLAHAVDDLVTPTDDVNKDVVAALESSGKCKEKLEEYFNGFGLPDPAKKSAAK